MLGGLNSFSYGDGDEVPHAREIELRLFTSYLDAWKGNTTKTSLVRLLERFDGRKSELPRDRLYSLFSVASDTQSFPIDYESTEKDVFLHALHHFRDSMCLWLWNMLVDVLENPMDAERFQDELLDTVFFSLHLSPCLVPDRAGNGQCCAICSDVPLPIHPRGYRMFCSKQLCIRSYTTHFYLAEAQAGHINQVDMLGVRKVNVESSADHVSLLAMYEIEISARTLTRLMWGPKRKRKYPYVVDRICGNIQPNSAQNVSLRLPPFTDDLEESSSCTYYLEPHET